ncbi:hypothetical protein FCG41_00280 [Azotobacter chroococcum]|nr:hypothetical protein FCG41_00280 [Azotobacter chroococcum]
MQTVQFLHAAFAKALPTIHARRLEALMAAVAALLQGRCLILTALGRSLPGSAWPRHAIKRIDHLLGNRQLQAERGSRKASATWLGIGLGLHRSRCPRRIEILLLIAVLANYALWRLGLEYARTGAGAISRETLLNLVQFHRCSCGNYGIRRCYAP